MSTIAAVIGRIFLGIIFIVSGLAKLTHIGATEAQITSVGLPNGLAIPVGIFELVAGLCLAFGIMTRLVAILLAVFIVLVTIFYHTNFADPMQLAMALKNLAIVGGMLLVFAHSQMWWSWDRMRAERRGEVVARQAELDARDAELRAARAQGAASVAGGTTAPVADTIAAPVDRRIDSGVSEVRPRRRWF